MTDAARVRYLTSSALLASSALAALAWCADARAAGFGLRLQSAEGLGSAYAGMAAGDDLSALFWNPATLSAVELFEAEALATGVLPDVNVELRGPLAGDEGDVGRNKAVPAGYIGYRLSDKLVVGLGLNAPFGTDTQYDDASILRTFGVAGDTDIFSVNANPSASYQVNDWLTLGLGAQIQYLSVEYTDQALPLGLDTRADLSGDDISLGVTAGVLVKPWKGGAIGLGYRSRIDHELDGEMDVDSGPTFDISGSHFDLPDVVSLGFRQTITDHVRVMAGVEWSNWSRFDTVTVTSDPGTFDLPFRFDDSWFFSAGAEYDVNDRLTVRGGIGYETTAIEDDARTFRLPDSNRLWLSAGASYQIDRRFSVSAGYSFVSLDDADILAATDGGPAANGPFSAEADTQIHLLSASVNYKLGSPVAGVLSGLARR